MDQKSAEEQATKIDQEVQDLLEKTDECAAQVDMEEAIRQGKETAQELQQPTED